VSESAREVLNSPKRLKTRGYGLVTLFTVPVPSRFSSTNQVRQVEASYAWKWG